MMFSLLVKVHRHVVVLDTLLCCFGFKSQIHFYAKCLSGDVLKTLPIWLQSAELYGHSPSSL